MLIGWAEPVLENFSILSDINVAFPPSTFTAFMPGSRHTGVGEVGGGLRRQISTFPEAALQRSQYSKLFSNKLITYFFPIKYIFSFK